MTDPDDIDRAMIRAEHDRQRRYFLSVLPLSAGLSGVLIAGLLIADGAVEPVALAWLGLAVAIVALGWGGLQMWRARPNAITHQLAARAGYWEGRQRARLASQLFLFIPAIGLLGWSLNAAWRLATGSGEWFHWAAAAIAVVIPLMGGLTVAGIGTGETSRGRSRMDDELTDIIRKRALATGYVALLAAATCIYLIGLWRPALAITLTPVALLVGSAAAALRFALLERKAERDG